MKEGMHHFKILVSKYLKIIAYIPTVVLGRLTIKWLKLIKSFGRCFRKCKKNKLVIFLSLKMVAITVLTQVGKWKLLVYFALTPKVYSALSLSLTSISIVYSVWTTNAIWGICLCKEAMDGLPGAEKLPIAVF